MKKHGADIKERKNTLKEEEKEDETNKTQEEGLRRHRKIRQCGEAFTHRSFYTQNPLHTDTFTHWRLYTQTHLHTKAATKRPFYTQTLLHTDTFTHRSFHTQALAHVHTQTLIHTEAFTHRCFSHRSFYTQKFLHTEAFTHRRFHRWVRTLHCPNQLTSFETKYIAISRQSGAMHDII